MRLEPPASMPQLSAFDATESQRVQVARGLACLLLVAFHAIGAQATSGMHVADDSGFRLFTNLLAYMRMPLFTLLSGFVYAYRPVLPDAQWAFAKKKLRRLAIPFAVATTLVYAGHLVAHDRPMPALIDAWRVYVIPIDHLWFVLALLGIFACLIVLEHFRALATPTRWCIVFAIAVAMHLTVPHMPDDVLSLNDVPYLLPYFLAGLALNRFREVFFTRKTLIVAALLLLVMQSWHTVYVLTQVHWSIDVTTARSVPGLLIGITAGMCALRWLPRSSIVQHIGTHSYAIYLYHPLFIGVARMALKHAELSPMVQFWMGMAVGLSGPIVLELLARRAPLAQLLFVGTVAHSRQDSREPEALTTHIPAAR